METSAKYAHIASIAFGAFVLSYGACSTFYAQLTAACLAVVQITAFLYHDSTMQFRLQHPLPSASPNKSAVTIVEELFPENMRERLYQRKQDAPLSSSSSEPFIMDIYPEATVLFAGLAGFTSWSSGRDPVQVFELLETLYLAFDALAAQHQIFKVETIGDAYLAMTGASTVADPNHALQMAAFARDMMITANRILCRSKNTETVLQLRIGLHSGSVAAGILRGTKSRCQIFGDTVNTATRTEALSEPGAIQVSQAFYHCVVVRGKGHWLRRRSDVVVAKGKGGLITYWLNLDDNIANDSTENNQPTRRRSSLKKEYLAENDLDLLPLFAVEDHCKMSRSLRLLQPPTTTIRQSRNLRLS